MTNLNISIEPESGEINIVLDDCINLTVTKDGDDLIYSKSFDNILDDDIYKTIRMTCITISKLMLRE